jgi:membrane fusion protein, protease secretion system
MTMTTFRPAFLPASAATTVQPRPAAPVSHAARVAFWAVLLGFGSFLLWAALAPLDEGVPSPATVSSDTKRKAVQHLSGGIVQEVLVREGDLVRDGQVLLRFDDAVARANFETVRQRYLGLRAMEGRLLAETAERATIAFHPDVLAAGSDPLIAQQMQTQTVLLEARRAAIAADVMSMNEGIRGLQAQHQGLMAMLVQKQLQLSLLREELTHTRGLVAEGYVPRNRQLELERMAAELESSAADMSSNLQRGERSVDELRQRVLQKRSEYKKEVASQLAEVRREGLSDADKLRSVTHDLERMSVRSPTTGQVVGLAFQTPGGVVPAAQKIMDIVPAGDSLLLEAKVPPHVIDRVIAGQAVDVRFSAFAHSPQLTVQGKVISVSHDVLTDPQSYAAYFLARVQVTPEGMATLGKRQLQPGMPAEVVFKTGERSLLSYLLHPLSKRVAAAMKEE